MFEEMLSADVFTDRILTGMLITLLVKLSRHWQAAVESVPVKNIKFSGFSYPSILLIWLTVRPEFFRSKSAFWKRIRFKSWEKVHPNSFLIYLEQ